MSIESGAMIREGEDIFIFVHAGCILLAIRHLHLCLPSLCSSWKVTNHFQLQCNGFLHLNLEVTGVTIIMVVN